jgi:hypothetical protein
MKRGGDFIGQVPIEIEDAIFPESRIDLRWRTPHGENQQQRATPLHGVKKTFHNRTITWFRRGD